MYQADEKFIATLAEGPLTASELAAKVGVTPGYAWTVMRRLNHARRVEQSSTDKRWSVVESDAP